MTCVQFSGKSYVLRHVKLNQYFPSPLSHPLKLSKPVGTYIDESSIWVKDKLTLCSLNQSKAKSVSIRIDCSNLSNKNPLKEK